MEKILCMCARMAYVSCVFMRLNTSNTCWLIYNMAATHERVVTLVPTKSVLQYGGMSADVIFPVQVHYLSLGQGRVILTPLARESHGYGYPPWVVGMGTGGCGCGYRFWIPTPIPILTWWVFRG